MTGVPETFHKTISAFMFSNFQGRLGCLPLTQKSVYVQVEGREV